MIRRPPRSTPLYSSAASDVYKRQVRLTLTGQPNSPCSSPVSDYMMLTIVGLPTADAGPPTVSICKEGYTLSGASATNYSSVSWSGGSGGIWANEHTLTPTYTPTDAEIRSGSVTLTLTVNG